MQQTVLKFFIVIHDLFEEHSSDLRGLNSIQTHKK